jgi:glycosyltransferase involved in cell wall biosynthesis
VYNGQHLITRCLDGIAAQSVSFNCYEVIIVDDGSTDDTALQVCTWKALHPNHTVRLLRQSNAGPAAARNHGAREARTNLIIFTDADCAPLPHWVDAFLNAFQNPSLAGARGYHLTEQNGLIPRFVGAEYADRFDRIKAGQAIDFIDTQSAAYRRDIFLENGGFDTIFPTACVEDQEFSFRLARRGYYLTFVPDAAVSHLYDETIRSYGRRKYYIGYWKALMLRWHKDRIVRDSHTPQLLKVQILLGYLIVPVAILALFGLAWSSLAWIHIVLAFLVLVFLGTTVPLTFKLAHHSWRIASIAPLMIAVRSLASGAGLAVGFINFARRPK